MSRKLSRAIWCIGITLVMSLTAFAAPRPLTDAQLDAVYAAGFDVEIKMGLDVAASNPEALVLQASDPETLTQLFTQGIPLTRAASSGRNEAVIDPSGAYMPNLQNLTVNNINITGEALKDATTLLNIFALDGDVAVGVNLNVIVNPTGGTYNINQTNMNWTNLLVSNALQTLGAAGSQ
jgi:hypothetical protein